MRKSHYTQIGKEMDWHPLEQGVFGDARKIKIAVVGIGREAGASFVAANLAYHLAKHVDGVTYMEAEDAQIAEALEGRRQVCYSLSLDRTLGLAAPLGLKRLSKHGRERAHAPDRNHESDRLPELDRKGERDRPTECSHLPEHDHGRAHASDRNRDRDHGRTHAFEQNRGFDRLPELDHKCRPDRPSDAFSMRGTRGKFTDYFVLEKEGLPVGSRRNLYANVNWAVRAPLEAPPSATTTIGTAAYDRAASSASILRTVPLRAAPAETSTLETSPTDASLIAWQAGQARSHAPLGTTVSDAQQCARSHAPFSEASTDTQQGAPLRQPRSRPTASEPQQRTRFHTPRPATSEPCMLAAPQGIGRIPGRYMIVDNPRPESLLEADLVICVVDPLPSRIRSGLQQLEALRENKIRFGKRFSPLLNLPSPILWVLNKDNPQISHRELERSLNIKFDFAVPLLSPEIFYKAEYSSVPIFQMLEAAGGRPHPSGISDMQHPRICPLAPKGADGGSPHSCCGTSAGKAGGRGFRQTGRAPAGASAGGSSGQPRSGCAAACSEFGRLAKRVLKLLD